MLGEGEQLGLIAGVGQLQPRWLLPLGIAGTPLAVLQAESLSSIEWVKQGWEQRVPLCAPGWTQEKRSHLPQLCLTAPCCSGSVWISLCWEMWATIPAPRSCWGFGSPCREMKAEKCWCWELRSPLRVSAGSRS